jgi:hypothetical protein
MIILALKFIPTALLVISGLFILFAIIFIASHLRPLTNDEVIDLAGKRRKNQIRFYFSFTNSPLIPDKEFKKKMDASGTFYNIDEPLERFPSVVASLLKYKKHEWIIIAFEKAKKIDLMWLNKGDNRFGVSSFLNLPLLMATAKLGNYNTILILHNHPNWNPNYYKFNKPSNQDISSANEFKNALNPQGLNLLEFVCERGHHYEYFLSPTESFYPVSIYLTQLENENGETKSKNLLLHFERVFQI